MAQHLTGRSRQRGASLAALLVLVGCSAVDQEPQPVATGTDPATTAAVTPAVVTPLGDRVAYPDGLWVRVAPLMPFTPDPALIDRLDAAPDATGYWFVITVGNETSTDWRTTDVTAAVRADGTPVPVACDVNQGQPCAFTGPVLAGTVLSSTWAVLIPPGTVQVTIVVTADDTRPAHTWVGPVTG